MVYGETNGRVVGALEERPVDLGLDCVILACARQLRTRINLILPSSSEQFSQEGVWRLAGAPATLSCERCAHGHVPWRPRQHGDAHGVRNQTRLCVLCGLTVMACGLLVMLGQTLQCWERSSCASAGKLASWDPNLLRGIGCPARQRVEILSALAPGQIRHIFMT